MAFDLTNASYVEKTKIDLSAELGPEAYVEMREPTKGEFLALLKAKDGGEAEIEAGFAKLLPDLIVGHGFTMGGKPASSKEVADAIGRKIKAANKVEGDYMAWVVSPFLSKTEQK